MPDFQIVQAVTHELRRQIFETLTTAAGVAFQLPSVDRISLAAPDVASGDSALASLYLYHIDIDPHLRNQRPIPDINDDSRFHRPPLPLRMRYLLTPLDDDDADNQVVLGLVLQHLQDNPSFGVIDGDVIDDSHGAVPARIKVRFEPMALDAQTNLWNAFSTPMRLAITLHVEVVAIDPAKAPQATPRVDQTILGTRRKDLEVADG